MKYVIKVVIHAHATLFPDTIPEYANINYRLVSSEELLEIYDKINVEEGILLPIVDAVSQVNLLSNEQCRYISDNSGGRLKWFCNVSPTALDNTDDADLSYLINHYKSLGAIGVGEITSQLYADDPKMDNLFYHSAQCDMPVIIHLAPQFGGTYGIVDDIHLPRIEKMLKKHKDLKLIGHSQTFWSEISADITEAKRMDYPSGKVTDGTIARLMREYGNLYCDLSAGSGANAMMRDRDYAARFMEEFADRIFYGCDICSLYNTFQYDFSDFLVSMVKDGYLSRENYIKIARNNAAKMFGMTPYEEAAQ